MLWREFEQARLLNFSAIGYTLHNHKFAPSAAYAFRLDSVFILDLAWTPLTLLMCRITIVVDKHYGLNLD